MSDPITSIFNCQTQELGSVVPPTFVFFRLDDPGMANMVRGVVQAVVEEMMGIAGVIKSYVPAPIGEGNPKKIAEIVNAIKDLPGTLIKLFVDKFLSKLKLPDFGKMIRDSINAASSAAKEYIVLPVIEFSKLLVDVLKGMLSGGNPLDAISAALEPIKAVVASAAGEIKNAVSWIAKVIEQYVKMLLAFVAVPLMILKLVIEFITSKFAELASGLGGLKDFIINGLTEAMTSLLKMLGLAPPDGKMSPIVQLFICLLKQCKEIITGFPGNLSGLAPLVA